MTFKKILTDLSLCAVLILSCALPIFSQTFREPLAAKGKYYSVYADSGVDLNTLLPRLNFDFFLHLDSVLGGGKKKEDILSRTIDSIYLEVSDILDIHMYSFHGNLVIVPDRTAVNEKFKKLFGQDFGERSFYVHQQNTIYISAADITVGMLGHEMSHAIQSHYFVVPPPTKVQEVLAGYVEYTLRKAMGTLP